MKLKLITASLCTTLLLASQASMALSVNGQMITPAQIQSATQLLQQQMGGQNIPPSQLNKMVEDQLVTSEVLKQEAIKKGLDKDPQTQAMIANIQAAILADSLVQNYIKQNPISDAMLKQQYQAFISEQSAEKEYKARHILVADKAQAEAIIAALKKGKPFAALAKEKTLDPSGKNNGGELGWNVPTTFVPEFGKALTTLKKGEVTAQPIKTEFGWHIIQLEDVRSKPQPPFEQLKPQLQQKLQQEKAQQYIQSLKNQATVKP